MRPRAIIVLLLAGALVPFLATAEASKDRKPREFVVAYSPRSVNLDPLHTFTSMESQFFTALYEGLLVNNPLTLEPMPGVASNWESSEKGRIWRFTLRPDALYSNGDQVRAQDFVDSWQRMIDPSQKAEYSFLFDVIKGARACRTGQEKDLAKVGIRAVSDSVLEVELEKPAAHFLKLLCHISFVPLHPSLLKGSGWNDAKSVIGNGPFVITARSDSEITLEKNKLYWDVKNLGLDRVRIRFIDDPGEATDGYLKGAIQWSTTFQSEKLKTNDKLEAFPMFGTSYFYFECDTPPWNDWRVRRGLALLLPWDQIRTKDEVFPTARLIPAISSYPEVKGIDAQQLDEGRKLLAEAGFPGGKGLPRLVIKVAAGSGVAPMLATMVDAWKKLIGLEAVINEVDASQYFSLYRTHDYTLGISTWIGDYADPLTFLQLWITGSNLNDARFSDSSYDAAVDEAVSQLDSAKRYRKLADAEQILLDKAVILPLYHAAAVHLIDLDRVDGWYPNPLDVHPFKFIKFKGKRTPPGIAAVDATPSTVAFSQ